MKNDRDINRQKIDTTIPRHVWYRGNWFNQDGICCGNQKIIAYTITRWVSDLLDQDQIEKILGVHQSGEVTPYDERSAAVRPAKTQRIIYFHADGTRNVEDIPFND